MSEEENVQHLPAQVTISKPPLNILFNPNIVGKKNVWDIDITSLLEKLLVILNAAGNKDLRLCGVAALSSAMILRLKVESIFALEKIAMQHKSTPDRSILENLYCKSIPIKRTHHERYRHFFHNIYKNEYGCSEDACFCHREIDAF